MITLVWGRLRRGTIPEASSNTIRWDYHSNIIWFITRNYTIRVPGSQRLGGDIKKWKVYNLYRVHFGHCKSLFSVFCDAIHGAVCFQLTNFSFSNFYNLSIIISIVGNINHCLGLTRNTIVCPVCQRQSDNRLYQDIVWWVNMYWIRGGAIFLRTTILIGVCRDCQVKEYHIHLLW